MGALRFSLVSGLCAAGAFGKGVALLLVFGIAALILGIDGTGGGKVAGVGGAKDIVLGAGDATFVLVLSAIEEFPLDLCLDSRAARPGSFGIGGASLVAVLMASRRSKTSE